MNSINAAQYEQYKIEFGKESHKPFKNASLLLFVTWLGQRRRKSKPHTTKATKLANFPTCTDVRVYTLYQK